jgi:dihydrofolate reductase
VSGTGKVVVHRAMSLDGYVAGPRHEMDWVFDYPAPARLTDAVMAATGAMLSGRHTYEVGRRSSRSQTSEPYGGAWSGAQLVLTHRPKAGSDDPETVFLSGSVEEAVRAGLAAAGGKNLEVLGTNVTAQCLAAGLVDEYVVHILPLLLGAGVPLHENAAMAAVPLQLLETTETESVVSLRYAVLAPDADGVQPKTKRPPE